jgi:hypothetical protein
MGCVKDCVFEKPMLQELLLVWSRRNPKSTRHSKNGAVGDKPESPFLLGRRSHSSTLFVIVTTIDESSAYSECQGVLSEHGQ